MRAITVLIMAAVLIAGCVEIEMPPPVPSYGTIIVANNFTNTTIAMYIASNVTIRDNIMINSTPFFESENSPVYRNIFTLLPLGPNSDNQIYCYNGQGNFYEESLTPITGDCGPSNITAPIAGNYTENITIIWTAQSSPLPVTYDIYVKNVATGQYRFLTSTSSLSQTVVLTMLKGYYQIELVPWVSGSRINGTHAISAEFGWTGMPSIQVSLKLNKCVPGMKVYIPGVGEMAASSVPNQTWYTPPQFWLAAYGDGLVWSLVFSQLKPIYIATES